MPAARKAIVVVEHAAALCDEDEVVRRSLSHQLRALSGSAAVESRAGCSAVLVRAMLPGAFGRRLPPRRTMPTGT